MIPVVQERELVAGGVQSSTSFDISGENVAHILTILRDTLYSDKIMAVLREYGANAWDSMRQAGKADVPIKVHVPSLVDPTLRIRDYGPGLSVEDVERIFTKYGASTKREDNLAVGMLGIGSKSGFAYSDSFSVTTWHGGRRREYVAVIDASQKGKMDLLHEEELRCECGKGEHVASVCPTGGRSETGVEISIAVKSQDIRDFETRAQRLFMHYDPRPVINTTLPSLPPGKDIGKLGRIYESTEWNDRGKWMVVMGCVPYRIDLNQLGRVTVDGTVHSVASAASNIGGTLYFDIGELQVAASREELKYGDSTKLALIRRINEIIDEFVRIMLKDIDKLSQWERRLRIREVDNKGLPIPKDAGDYRNSYVELRPPVDGAGKPSVIKMTCRNYNGTQSDSRSLRVERPTKIVIKDDKRTVKGFTGLSNHELLVSPVVGVSHSAMLAEVKRLVKFHNIEGIPIVMLSTYTWTAPTKNSTGYRDPVKAKAQCLVLAPTTSDFGATPLSRHWEPVTRTPSDKDVWVILDSYRVGDYVGPTGDFYEQFMADRAILSLAGLAMPEIIGYKTMAAKPIVRAKLKGTDYGEWRKKGLIQLLLTNPEVARLAKALEMSDGTGYAMDAEVLAKRLGDKHPITLYAEKVNAARTIVAKADAKLTKAAKFVRASIPDSGLEITRLRKELNDTYPLLRITIVDDAFPSYGPFKELWIDYVRLVDASDEQKKSDKQKEEKEKAA